jgi:flagellar FliL protein
MLGMGAHESAEHGQAAVAEAPRPLAFFDMPEIIANLNATGRRPVYVKLRSKLEITRAEDAAAIQLAMPRLLDLFQTHLREVRPDELRGSAGTQRLREELVARANIAVAPPQGSTRPAPRITDVLFVEILVQ